MFNIQYFESVNSTMDIARNNPSHGIVIQAGEQLSGRGRRGNEWTSPKGNLYQSIILKPKVDKSQWGQLSFVIAVALGRTCNEIGIGDYQLKWPNDVLIDNKKLAGILIEVLDDFVIIGTGINIKTAPSDRSKIHDYNDIGIDDFRDAFLRHLNHYYDLWQDNNFALIRKEWMRHAYRLGDTIQARLPQATYTGIFEDLDDTGILLLREKNGNLMKINSGEILV